MNFFRAQFVARGMKLNETLTESFTKRGEAAERQVTVDFNEIIKYFYVTK